MARAFTADRGLSRITEGPQGAMETEAKEFASVRLPLAHVSHQSVFVIYVLSPLLPRSYCCMQRWDNQTCQTSVLQMERNSLATALKKTNSDTPVDSVVRRLGKY